MTTKNFCNTWLSKGLNKDKVTCITQEFGTVMPHIVAQNMILENYAHFHGSDEEKKIYRERYKNCFYVQEVDWKRNVGRRGLVVLLQGLYKMGVSPEDYPLPQVVDN